MADSTFICLKFGARFHPPMHYFYDWLFTFCFHKTIIHSIITFFRQSKQNWRKQCETESELKQSKASKIQDGQGVLQDLVSLWRLDQAWSVLRMSSGASANVALGGPSTSSSRALLSCGTLIAYLKTLDSSTLHQLYNHPATCLAVFR